MPDAQSEPPKLNHIAPPWFHDRWESLIDWMKSHRVVQGKNTTLTDAPGGGKAVNVEFDNPRISRYPWRVKPSTELNTDGSVKSLKLAVELKSYILSDIQVDNVINVTGMNIPQEVEDDEDMIWIDIGFPGTVASIVVGKIADWENWPSPVEWDETGPTRAQTHYRHLLGYFAPSTADGIGQIVGFPGGESARLKQTTSNDLILCTKCFASQGEEVKVLENWFSPYIIT